MLWIEFAVAAFVAVASYVTARFLIKEHHADPFTLDEALKGAMLYGVFIGVLVGFMLLPVRVMMMDQGIEEAAASAGSVLPLGIALLLYFRSDFPAAAPVLGRYFAAYKVAMLRRASDRTDRRVGRILVRAGAGAREGEAAGANPTVAA